MALRYCSINYDREIVIVAERHASERGRGEREMVEVGRLIADADHASAEFAVLVVDAWQKHGLGAILTDYCLAIAQEWQVRRITAETSPDNLRMLALLQRRGFTLDRSVATDTVVVTKEIGE